METPEFTFEQDAGNVAQAVRSDGLRYPVAQDNRYGTWNAWGNQYWPAAYLIDASGQVRHTKFGEGDYAAGERAVRSLLGAAGARHLPPPMSAHAQLPAAAVATPETYLDPQRAMGFAVPPQAGTHDYPGVSHPQLNEFGLRGRWRTDSESATPVSPAATIQARVQAASVYLVLTSAGNLPRTVRVLLDGRPITPRAAGADVHEGAVRVTGQRLYALVSRPTAEQHDITVEIPPAVSAYDFTFG